MDDLSFSLEIPQQFNKQLPDPALLQYYTDLGERCYALYGEIDSALLDFVMKIITWNREDKGVEIQDRKPIRFYINSPGGDLEIYRTVRDVIELSKTPIIAINLGSAYSAAALLFLCCQKRLMLKSSNLLLHKGSASFSGGFNEISAAMDEYTKQVEEFVVDIQKNTTYSEEEIRKNMQTDWYISSTEALERGAATKIIDNIDDIL